MSGHAAPPRFEARYRLHEVALTVRADAEMGETVDFILRYLRAEPTPADGSRALRWDFALAPVAEPLPEGTVLLGRNAHGVTAHQVGERYYFAYGASCAAIDPQAGQAWVRLTPAVWSRPAQRRGLLYDLVLLALLTLLRPRGLFALHAAGVARDGDGFLIPAPGHSGKSTLALGLLRTGWHYLSDDLVLLSGAEGQVEARGLFRHFRFDPAAVRRFPELAPHTQPAGTLSDKLHLAVDACFPGRYRPCCRPRVLLFPEIAERSETVPTPLTPGQALLRLLAQTSLPARDRTLAGRQLDVFRHLAEQTRAFHLALGTDLYHDPTRAESLLASL